MRWRIFRLPVCSSIMWSSWMLRRLGTRRGRRSCLPRSGPIRRLGLDSRWRPMTTPSAYSAPSCPLSTSKSRKNSTSTPKSSNSTISSANSMTPFKPKLKTYTNKYEHSMNSYSSMKLKWKKVKNFKFKQPYKRSPHVSPRGKKYCKSSPSSSPSSSKKTHSSKSTSSTKIILKSRLL